MSWIQRLNVNQSLMNGGVIHIVSFFRPGSVAASRPGPRLPALATPTVPVGNCGREPARGCADAGATGFPADGRITGCAPFLGMGAPLPLVLSSAPMSTLPPVPRPPSAPIATFALTVGPT